VLDHVTVAASTLASGVDYVTALTGAAPRPGGKHVAMGTHNALMRLGSRVYLEIIAIDPDGVKPDRPRWFNLDDPALQTEIAKRPRLVAWAARTDDIDGALTSSPIPLGRAQPFTRGNYRWRLTVSDDGRLPGDGILPLLIQWDVAMHPADALPDSGVSIVGISATHPDSDRIGQALAALRLAELLPLTRDSRPRLTATLETPRGGVTL
jgi:hypothetical protein